MENEPMIYLILIAFIVYMLINHLPLVITFWGISMGITIVIAIVLGITSTHHD